MNVNDLQRANELSNEKLSIQAALGMLDSGGKISTMTVSGGTYDGPMPSPFPGGAAMPGMQGMPVTIQTNQITYPPAMVEAIKTALQPRLKTIDDELGKLGVTLAEEKAAKK